MPNDNEKNSEEFDGNVHVMPELGPEHLESKDCWCEPELIEDAAEYGGCKAYLHKELQ